MPYDGLMKASLFNICDESGDYLCPACGFPGYFNGTSYDERGGNAGTGICPCCHWEPGFDDDPAVSRNAKPTILGSLQAYRSGWSGSPAWSGRPDEIPEGWDGAAQLTHLFEIAPYVR